MRLSTPRLVLREILRNPELRLKPVGFVDDDPLKRRLRIDGVRVLGTTQELGQQRHLFGRSAGPRDSPVKQGGEPCAPETAAPAPPARARPPPSAH